MKLTYREGEGLENQRGAHKTEDHFRTFPQWGFRSKIVMAEEAGPRDLELCMVG